MKKIVIYTGSFASGGAEKQSMLLAKALNSYYDIVIISHYGEKELGKYIGYLESNKIVYYPLAKTHDGISHMSLTWLLNNGPS